MNAFLTSNSRIGILHEMHMQPVRNMPAGGGAFGSMPSLEHMPASSAPAWGLLPMISAGVSFTVSLVRMYGAALAENNHGQHNPLPGPESQSYQVLIAIVFNGCKELSISG